MKVSWVICTQQSPIWMKMVISKSHKHYLCAVVNSLQHHVRLQQMSMFVSSYKKIRATKILMTAEMHRTVYTHVCSAHVSWMRHDINSASPGILIWSLAIHGRELCKLMITRNALSIYDGWRSWSAHVGVNMEFMNMEVFSGVAFFTKVSWMFHECFITVISCHFSFVILGRSFVSFWLYFGLHNNYLMLKRLVFFTFWDFKAFEHSLTIGKENNARVIEKIQNISCVCSH